MLLDFWSALTDDFRTFIENSLPAENISMKRSSIAAISLKTTCT